MKLHHERMHCRIASVQIAKRACAKRQDSLPLGEGFDDRFATAHGK